MSFSGDVRAELTRAECAWDCCARAELAAALIATGGISFRGPNRYGLSITTEHSASIRYFYLSAKKFFGVAGEIRTLKTAQLGERLRYQLIFPDADVDGLMDALSLRDANAPFGVASVPDGAVLRRQCCRAAFLKSAFLCAGSVSNPEKEYHLEVAVGNDSFANCVSFHMCMFGLNAHVAQRKSQYVAYIKDIEGITTMLTLIGAHSAVMKLENIRIMKQLRNDVNRRLNCDSSNIDRTVSTAQAQIEDIRLIARRTGFDRLPASLREIAEVRVNEPNATLTELGELCEPKIGKSGVNKRLRRIAAIASELRGDDPTEIIR